MNSIYIPIDDRLVDLDPSEESGYPPELMAEDTPDNMRAAFGDTDREFPPHLLIDPSQYKDKAKQNDEMGLWPIDYIDRYTNQSPTHECTTHSLRTVAECARNRARRIKLGPPVAGQRLPISENSASVWLSCISIYSEANPRQRGGASTRGVLEIACRRGFLPDRIQPREYGFKHQLVGTCGKGGVNQSSGRWVALRDFPDGWEQTAKHFKPLECCFLRTDQEVVSAILNGYAVGVGRRGHALPYVRVVWDSRGRMLCECLDSYDRLTYDSDPASGYAYTIMSMTTPDSYDKPAG